MHADRLEGDGVTPKFLDTPPERQLIKAACAELGWAQENWKPNLEEVFQREAYNFSSRRVGQQDISEALKNSAEPRLVEIRRAFWIFFHRDYPHVFKHVKRTLACGHFNPVAASLHGQINQDNAMSLFDEDSIRALRGAYKVYRRYYKNPKNIMVARLECGTGENPVEFKMTMREDNIKSPSQLSYGVIVPSKSGVLFQGTLHGLRGPFIFYLTALGNNTEGKVERGYGVLLASADGHLPSSYAMFILRCDTDFEPQVLSEADFMDDTDLYEEIVLMLSRGYVAYR